MNINTTGGVNVVAATDLDDSERTRHERFMSEALAAASDAHSPFAALIVDRRRQRIICRGINRKRDNPILHGEVSAILNCAELNSNVQWQTLSLYTTAEPCPMCAAAIVWAGISEVVYGTSIAELASLGINQIRLESEDVARAAPFYRGTIIGGVLADRTFEMYRDWAQTNTAQKK